MKAVKLFFAVFILFFSFSSVNSIAGTNSQPASTIPSVYNLLQKLEEDIKAGKSAEVIKSEVKKIEKAKKVLPVSYVPELNYLVSPAIEEIPPGKITFFKKLIYYLYPLEVSLKVFLFLILFYTFVFYFQNTEISPLGRRILTLAGIVLLSVSFVLNVCPLIYFLLGFGLILIAVLKRKKLLVYFSAAVLMLFFSHTLQENVSLLLRSNSFLYEVKISRDGYAPQYLVNSVLKKEEDATLEQITSDLALGKLDSVSLLKKLKFSDNLHRAIKLNDLGYFEFLHGNFKKALLLFKKAYTLYPSSELEYNLYLTYSSLLKFDKANRVKKDLLSRGIHLEKLPPVPVLMHIPAPIPEYEFPFVNLLGFLLGIFSGVLFTRYFLAGLGSFEPELLLVPGMKSFINSRFKHIITITVAVFIINIILGKLICSM